MRGLLAALLFAVGLAGCGLGEPTVADFCETVDSEGARLNKLGEEDPIAAIFEMEVMFQRVADNSPSEIKESAQIVADAIKEAAAGAEMSISGMTKVSQAVLRFQTHFDRIDEYHQENCT